MSRSDLLRQAEDIAARGASLPLQQEAAKADFILEVRRGSSEEVVEAARLRCVSIFEAQLDLVIEAGVNQRALAMESGREPQ